MEIDYRKLEDDVNEDNLQTPSLYWKSLARDVLAFGRRKDDLGMYGGKDNKHSMEEIQNILTENYRLNLAIILKEYEEAEEISTCTLEEVKELNPDWIESEPF